MSKPKKAATVVALPETAFAGKDLMALPNALRKKERKARQHATKILARVRVKGAKLHKNHNKAANSAVKIGQGIAAMAAGINTKLIRKFHAAKNKQPKVTHNPIKEAA